MDVYRGLYYSLEEYAEIGNPFKKYDGSFGNW